MRNLERNQKRKIHFFPDFFLSKKVVFLQFFLFFLYTEKKEEQKEKTKERKQQRRWVNQKDGKGTSSVVWGFRTSWPFPRYFLSQSRLCVATAVGSVITPLSERTVLKKLISFSSSLEKGFLFGTAEPNLLNCFDLTKESRKRVWKRFIPENLKSELFGYHSKKSRAVKTVPGCSQFSSSFSVLQSTIIHRWLIFSDFWQQGMGKLYSVRNNRSPLYHRNKIHTFCWRISRTILGEKTSYNFESITL